MRIKMARWGRGFGYGEGLGALVSWTHPKPSGSMRWAGDTRDPLPALAPLPLLGSPTSTMCTGSCAASGTLSYPSVGANSRMTLIARGGSGAGGAAKAAIGAW